MATRVATKVATRAEKCPWPEGSAASLGGRAWTAKRVVALSSFASLLAVAAERRAGDPKVQRRRRRPAAAQDVRTTTPLDLWATRAATTQRLPVPARVRERTKAAVGSRRQ